MPRFSALRIFGGTTSSVTLPAPVEVPHLPSINIQVPTFHGCLFLLRRLRPASSRRRRGMHVANLQTQPPFLLTLAPLRFQNPETSRLLHDDPYRSQYGTDQSRRRAQDEPDPTEMTPREREAQQRICHAMSEYVTYLRPFYALVALPDMSWWQ